MKNQNPKAKTNKGNNTQTIVIFIIAALTVLLMILCCSSRSEPRYELTIKEIGTDSITVISNYEELGAGEIQFRYDEDMLVQDVNGQVIDLIDLRADDRIFVEFSDKESDSQTLPAVEMITLIPTGSSEYI